MVESLSALGKWDPLREFLPEARRVSRGLAVLGPACDRAEGVLLRATGDAERGGRLLGKALDGFETLRVPFEAARTREELARLDGPELARHLERAYETYERLGARPHAERVAAKLKGAQSP
jgi:hypothetical protein